MEDEVILISSDDESDGEVIFVSSSDEEYADVKQSINHCHNIKVEVKPSPPSSDEGIFNSDDDDLPDIRNISYFAKDGDNSKSDIETDAPCAPCDEHFDFKKENISPSKIEYQGVKRKESFKFQCRRPATKCKRVKVVKEEHPLSSAEEDDVDYLSPLPESIHEELPDALLLHCKQQIILNLMTGELRRNPLSRCSSDIGCCSHQAEGKSKSTSTQSKYMLEVMLDNTKLQHFALRAMCKSVTKENFLHHSVRDMLLQHIHGSEENMEIPVLENLYLGISILKKQLALHPSCKREMRQYYLEMVANWWPTLMKSAADLLSYNSSQNSRVPLEEEEVIPSESLGLQDFSNFEDLTRKEDIKKHVTFQNITKSEKIHRITMLLQYFMTVMHSNVSVWLIKFRHDKQTAALRKDISPIAAEITWKNDFKNFGSVNQNVRDLFHLFSKSSKEQNLHSILSVMINIKASIIHRWEKSSFPEMGPITRSFAYGLFKQIQGSFGMEDNIRSIRPHWLRFLVISYLLAVEEPPNFYKVKERIFQTLNAKDKGRTDTYRFDVEKICFYMLESMAKMMGFSSTPTESFPSIEILMEEPSLWFRKMLDDKFLTENIQTLSLALSLPPVTCSNRKGYYFDYVESYLERR